MDMAHTHMGRIHFLKSFYINNHFILNASLIEGLLTGPSTGKNGTNNLALPTFLSLAKQRTSLNLPTKVYFLIWPLP